MLGSHLKKQPAFGYHKAMHRTVLTLLVGMMLSLGGGASALTFGSDGKAKNVSLPPDFTGLELRCEVNKPALDNRALMLPNDHLTRELQTHQIASDGTTYFKENAYHGQVTSVTERSLKFKYDVDGNLFSYEFRAGMENQIWLSIQGSWIAAGSTTYALNGKCLVIESEKPSSAEVLSRKADIGIEKINKTTEKLGVDKFACIRRSILDTSSGRSKSQNVSRSDTQPESLIALYRKEEKFNVSDFQQTPLWKNGQKLKGKLPHEIRDRKGFKGPTEVVLLENDKLIIRREGRESWTSGIKILSYAVHYQCDGAYTLIVNNQQSPGIQRPTNLAAKEKASAVAVPSEKNKEEPNQRQIASDSQAPLLTIIQSGANGREGYLTGSVTDNVQVAEVLVDGTPVSFTADGSFGWTGFVPAMGKEIVVEAIDTAALSSRQVVRIERSQKLQRGILRFDGLNPMSGEIAHVNQEALALIVGISEYDRTNAPAIFADNDAQFFQDYAALKLGIPENNITTLVNGNAEQADVLLSVKNWLSRAVKQEQSDVYIFFAGHGLASDDGEKMYLLPYDGAPELLDKTSILRDELFNDIAAANPRSVTVFLDTCYSGTTRGPDMLIASRPIAIRAKEQSVPEGFTVMTAAAGDQTAKPLEEAKHGMFSYFLMKGMEGDADANQDNQITAGELHAYVQQNVIQQSSGSQTPELQGDADRVLVRFQ